MLAQGTMAPWARRPRCVWRCDAQIGRGRPRDFRDLPTRRDEGRVAEYTPWCLKGLFFGEKRRRRKKRKREEREREEPDLGWRSGKSTALDGEGMRVRALVGTDGKRARKKRGLVRVEWKDDERR
ncbi:hypothetical protein TNCV_4098481 [Trichonephila clavipes]|nr:hypothetical protein TNCV_4098481 [Trichonephila clavipes]